VCDGVWTHVVAPTDSELAELVEMYTLDETILADISDVFEVPRFEKDGSIYYFFARYPYDVKDIDIDTAPILIILGKTFLVTITCHETPFLKQFIDDVRLFSTINRTEFFFEILSEMFLEFERKLTHTRKLVYRDMGRIRSIRSRDIQRLVFFEQELNETVSALVPMKVWLQKLTKSPYFEMFDDEEEVLEDLIIRSTQLIDSTISILKTIQNIRTASEAILTQNLNTTIRILTVFTIILTIPTLIASLFGMNVKVPFAEASYGFWYVLLIITVAVLIAVYFFTKNRWI
jgi:magnesium transporter